MTLLVLALLAACGGRTTETAPDAAPSGDPCLRFATAPSIVAPPSPVPTLDPAIVPGAGGTWVLAWRDALNRDLHLDHLDPTLFPIARDRFPIATSTIGRIGLAADGDQSVVSWREGAVLKAWRHDADLVAVAPPRTFQANERVPAPVDAALVALDGDATLLVWHGSAATPPYTVWDIEERDTVPPVLPHAVEAEATAPGALAAAPGQTIAVWPQKDADGPWILKATTLGDTTPVDLATLPDAPTSIDAGLGDGLVVAWTAKGEAHVQRAGLTGAPIGDPLDLGASTAPAVAVSGPRELVAWVDDHKLRLRRLDAPTCVAVDPTDGVDDPGAVDVALDLTGHGVVVWEGPGPAGTRVVWGRPFSMVDPTTTAAR